MKRNFRILEGGANHLKEKKKKFNSAFVTNTRLMGAMGLYILWDFEGSDESEFLLQYFYFETDKNGLEGNEEAYNDNKAAFKILENIMQTLGGEKISISYKEAIFLIQKYHEIRAKNNIPPCTNIKNYEFLLKEDGHLTCNQINALNNKILDPIDTVNQVCHYAMLRIFENDIDGLKFLCKKEPNTESFKKLSGSSLCKNAIKEASNNAFFCESLIEKNNSYYIVKTKLEIDNFKINKISHLTDLAVTSMEAALIMSKAEFISLYLIDESCPFKNYNEFTAKAPIMQYPHPHGNLFMVFKSKNNYMKNPTYHIHDDIIGSYFVSDSGEIIIFTSKAIKNKHIENLLLKTPLAEYIMLGKRYHFDDPVVLDFIQSGLKSFEEFVEIISQDDPN